MLRESAGDTRRHVVWVCCGCDDCEPLDGSAPSRFPCRAPMSSDGAEVVRAEDYDRLREALEKVAATQPMQSQAHRIACRALGGECALEGT